MDNNDKSLSKLHLNTIEDNNSFCYYEYIDIILGDPITALLLNDKFVAIGTMMGRIKLYLLNNSFEKITNINNGDLENISGLSFNEVKRTLFASIGDEKILRYIIKDELINNTKPELSIDIYENPAQHNCLCDNAYVLMAQENLIKIDLYNFELDEEIKNTTYKYEIIFFDDSSPKITGFILSTNYLVPLDFDGFHFIYVEYLNDKKDRDFCIKDVIDVEVEYEIIYRFKVNEKYGHISHAKILKDNKVIIVHDFNKCEIRKFTNNFELLESFKHIGDEVYAIDIFYEDIINSYNENIDENINKNKIKEKDIKHELNTNNEKNVNKAFNENIMNESKISNRKKLPKIDLNRNKQSKIVSSNEIKTDSLDLLRNKTKKTQISEKQNMNIITLDIDGNVNNYRNGFEEILFNLYKLKNIHIDHKDKRFFDMGYVYYIKTNLNFFCITTDFGCYIIKKNE